MARVAVAGGTNGLGRTVTEAIIALKKHTVFVLSRGNSEVFASEHAVTVLVINYSDPSSISTILKTNQIDTIFSCLSMNTEEQSQAQLNLIDGAVLSGTVTRFAPSDFGMDYVEAEKQNCEFPGSALKLAAITKLRSTPSLQYTRFVNGTFMDYFGPPVIPTHLRTFSLVLDIEQNKAVIPGDGNVPVVLTHSSTIAKFVAASLDLKTWPEASYIMGQKLTFNELVSIAENVKGQKFDVKYDTIEDLESGKNTELPANVPRYETMPKWLIDRISQIFGVAAAKGMFSFPEANLNVLLPSVRPLTINEFLSGAESGGI